MVQGMSGSHKKGVRTKIGRNEKSRIDESHSNTKELFTMSKIEDKVCAKIQARAEVGEKKYGVTMEREDLTLKEWLTHLQEEMMDAIVYIQKVMDCEA